MSIKEDDSNNEMIELESALESKGRPGRDSEVKLKHIGKIH